MADTPRIEELRRRIQKDPASIAFAQLAEEHRRRGEFEEAVRVARAGLDQHPAYLSARVTLGRALMELGRFDEAQGEFEHVLLGAPDNLIAIRSMAELHQRRDGGVSGVGELSELGELGGRESVAPVDPVHPVHPVHPVDPPSPALAELEGWLAAIRADRAGRA